MTLDDEVSYALLVVLEALSPPERTAFVLHDLFGMPFGEVATVVGRSPDAVRQLASRARRHVRSRGALPSSVNAAEHRRVVSAFSSAVTSGDLAALIRVLDPSVVLVSDGGGVVSSARRPILHGPGRPVLAWRHCQGSPDGRIAQVDVNGVPGFALYQDGDLATVVSVTVAHDRVTRLDLVRAPDKLPHPAATDER